jgi:hypothetical protein
MFLEMQISQIEYHYHFCRCDGFVRVCFSVFPLYRSVMCWSRKRHWLIFANVLPHGFILNPSRLRSGDFLLTLHTPVHFSVRFFHMLNMLYFMHLFRRYFADTMVLTEVFQEQAAKRARMSTQAQSMSLFPYIMHVQARSNTPPLNPHALRIG